MNKEFSANRTNGMGTSIFATMSKLAFEHKAVNLGQGFPDFDGPQWLMDEAYKCMKEGKNQYAPTQGILSLRKAISEIQQKYYGMEWNPESDITITAGATEALYSTFQALINEGDEVIMFEPFYDSYQADVILAGGIPRYVTLQKPDFHFDYNELEQTITDKTKIIVINTPHNPTGKVYTFDELNFIAKLTIKHNLLVVSDEVYEFLTFDNAKHIPIASIPGMRDRTITISSAGKTFSMTGWKIGWAIASNKITEAIRKVHQWTTFAVNTPGQHAIAYSFTKLDEYLPNFRKEYLDRRDLLLSELKTTSFNAHKPLGSYFMMVDIPESSMLNDEEIAVELVKNYKIATIPPSVFYGKSNEGRTMLRLCFAKSNETLIEGAENLRKFK
ncbi:MAG: aminotransferase class I/II-fold pyridoxal phosphate-dependent enzyme [Ignavibacteriae bacterium]|nr:aminotransferase class I/II-fold pyridoxal phosphate-dependent enzyme [Ignavibacteriota bacterium]